MCFHSPNIHLKERHLTIEPQKKKKTSEPMFSGCMVYTDTYFQSPCQTELSCMSLPVDLSRQSWLRFLVKNAFLLS